MADPEKIREIVERNVKFLALKPDRGHLTATTTARMVDGLRCEIGEGSWKLTADLPVKAGGEETAPTPGMLGRGALASCLAIGITLWAARMGIHLDGLEVEVECDFDARSELGANDDIHAGYKEIRYSIAIDSPASAEALAELLDKAERHSPYLAVFSRAHSLERVVRLNGKEI
jgi:uncharacterized OsmC-like protein